MGYSIFEETMVDMPWPELEKAIKGGAAVLLPTGVIEEHGPHMGLGVDTYLSYLVCKLTRHELESRGVKTLIAPPYYWGINNATGSFPGSFTVRKETMKSVLFDILDCLKRWGADCVFNINWHDDSHHCAALLEAIKEGSRGTGIKAFSVISNILARRLGLAGEESNVLIYDIPLPKEAPPQGLDIHAGSFETGAMVNYFPDEVNVEMSKALKPTNIKPEDFKVWRQGWDCAKKITPLGYLGNPADA